MASCINVDVHQFSIITELLGTPPDDVISTICSENVSNRSAWYILHVSYMMLLDASICQESSQT